MSLATRCTACGTIFRVVQDQLRVSEGWVRCGRCAEVFDAREQLFDMDREAPPPWPAAPTEPEPAAPPLAAPREPDAFPMHAGMATPATRPDDTTWVLPPEPEVRQEEEDEDALRPPDVASEPEEPLPAFMISQPAADTLLDDQPARREPYWSVGESKPAVPAEPPPLEPPSIAQDPRPDVLIDERLAALAAQVAATPATPTPTPEATFLRQADGAARWRRPRVRLALGLSALLLLLLLALQLTWHFRNALQTLYPPVAPALRALCEATGCELQPWRRIDALAVESSSLTQAGSGNNYKLTLLLRNKAAYPLALPWVDLHLTDASGAAIARRMLKPADFNLSKPAIAGETEESLQLVFGTGKLKVSGYSVEIFHP